MIKYEGAISSVFSKSSYTRLQTQEQRACIHSIFSLDISLATFSEQTSEWHQMKHWPLVTGLWPLTLFSRLSIK